MDAILHATPGNPIPGTPLVGFFEGYRGVKLRYAVFRSSAPKTKGTIVLVHGRNESIEKYFETIREMNERGFWVATYDFRGQGGSQRLLKDARKGHVRRFDHYIRDLEIFLEQIVLPDTRLPFFLLAHSTGGLIALKAAPRLSNRIERMVLTAPFVGLGGQKTSPENIKRISALASFTGLGSITLTKDEPLKPFAGNPLTTDEFRFARNQKIMMDHPELTLGPPTARWIYESQKAIDDVRPRPSRLDHSADRDHCAGQRSDRAVSFSGITGAVLPGRTAGADSRRPPRNPAGAGPLSHPGDGCPVCLHPRRRAGRSGSEHGAHRHGLGDVSVRLRAASAFPSPAHARLSNLPR